MPSKRQTGIVCRWLNGKGVGFITPDGLDASRDTDILVHVSSVKQTTEDGFKSLADGSKVEYELGEDPKNSDKKVAINVTGIGGADCTARVKGSGKGKGSSGKGGRAEKRADNADGLAYTLAQFVESYGETKGNKIWEAAGKRKSEPTKMPKSKTNGKAEKRTDNADGMTYTWAQLEEFYGEKKAGKIWEASGNRSAEPTTKAKGKTNGKAEKRTDNADGVAYTWAQLEEFYGEKKAGKIWEAAGNRTAEPSTKAKGKAEKRTDNADGVAYTWAQLEKFYGEYKADKIWEAAGRRDAY